MYAPIKAVSHPPRAPRRLYAVNTSRKKAQSTSFNSLAKCRRHPHSQSCLHILSQRRVNRIYFGVYQAQSYVGWKQNILRVVSSREVLYWADSNAFRGMYLRNCCRYKKIDFSRFHLIGNTLNVLQVFDVCDVQVTQNVFVLSFIFLLLKAFVAGLRVIRNNLFQFAFIGVFV